MWKENVVKGFGNKIWKKTAVACMALCLAFSGCEDAGNGESSSRDLGTSIEESTESVESVESTQDSQGTSESSSERVPVSMDLIDFFHVVPGWVFNFSSGAGGWETNLMIGEDGEFAGEYHDYDLGDVGAGYDNGTVYRSKFSGKFTDIKKVSEYTYEATVSDLKYENVPGTKEIVDGMLQIYTEAYGISGTDKVVIYLPGKKLEQLPEEYLNWIGYLNFGSYVNGQYYSDYPEELPFCGIFNAEAGNGFSSYNAEAINSVYVVNRAKFPGLSNVSLAMMEEGKYYYHDVSADGRYEVINVCFKKENGNDNTYSSVEEFVDDVINHVTNGKAYDDMYYLDYSFADSMPQMILMNGRVTYVAGWTCGTGEDKRYYVARCLEIDGFYYAYAYSSSENDEFLRGEAGGFLLSSLTLSGDALRISTESKDKVVRKIQGVVISNGTDPSRIMVDEVVMIGLEDEDLIEKYKLDPETDMLNDYAVVGLDQNYKEYRLSENCPIYIQYPEEGPFEGLCDQARFHKKLTDGKYEYLMELYLDENDVVTFMYEPFRP